MSQAVHQSDVTRCSPEWCHQVFIPVPRAWFITASADVTCSGTSWRRKVVYLGCFSTKPSTLHVSIARLDPCCHPFICSPQPSTLPPSLCPVSITCFHIFNLSPFPSPAVGLSNSPPSNFVELLPVFYKSVSISSPSFFAITVATAAIVVAATCWWSSSALVAFSADSVFVGWSLEDSSVNWNTTKMTSDIQWLCYARHPFHSQLCLSPFLFLTQSVHLLHGEKDDKRLITADAERLQTDRNTILDIYWLVMCNATNKLS